MPSGELTPQALERLEQIGEWMAVNGEAIHDTRAIAPYSEGDVRFTQKDGYIYAFSPTPSAELTTLMPAPGCEVKVLGFTKPAKVSTHGESVRLEAEVVDASLPIVFKYRS